MRTDLKLLAAGLALVTAAVAGCSSADSGPAGAMQDDVTMTEAPASTGPTSSADPVASPAASSVEPSADPSVDSSEAVSLLGAHENNDVCDSGLAYACGDIGASGVGTVFYASATPFACGLNGASSCNYLEVAPNGWNGKLVDCWNGCGGSPNKTSDFGQKGIGTGRGYAYCNAQRNLRTVEIPNAAGRVIGTGYTNTTALIQSCEAGDAGALARGYTGGGMTDWSLPSADELVALYHYPNRDAIGGFAAGIYWSSTQVWAGHLDVWTGVAMDFRKGEGITIAYHYENDTLGVRPVRAF